MGKKMKLFENMKLSRGTKVLMIVAVVAKVIEYLLDYLTNRCSE